MPSQRRFRFSHNHFGSYEEKYIKAFLEKKKNLTQQVSSLIDWLATLHVIHTVERGHVGGNEGVLHVAGGPTQFSYIVIYRCFCSSHQGIKCFEVKLFPNMAYLRRKQSPCMLMLQLSNLGWRFLPCLFDDLVLTDHNHQEIFPQIRSWWILSAHRLQWFLIGADWKKFRVTIIITIKYKTPGYIQNGRSKSRSKIACWNNHSFFMYVYLNLSPIKLVQVT